MKLEKVAGTRRVAGLTVSVMMIAGLSAVLHAEMPVQLKNGETADADDVMENFNDLDDRIADYEGAIHVDGDGNVGIGTTDPEERLHVIGNVRADDYTFNSDIRLKRDVAPLQGASEGINCLQGVSYRWRDPDAPQDLQIGLVAQDVEACFPEVVSTNGDGYKTVSYARLVAPLIEASKEEQRVNAGQQTTISRLQDEVAQLKAQQKQTDARLARLEALLNAGQ